MTAPDDPGDDPAGSNAGVAIDAPRVDVFGYLTDPTTYPDWLVGAQDIRTVDPDWPRLGTRFHHRVGVGPFHLRDATTVVEIDAPNEFVLRAGIGPLGAAIVRFRLAGSSPTLVSFEEAPASGPMRVLGRSVGALILKATIWGRNQVSLQQLAALIESDHERSLGRSPRRTVEQGR